MQDIIETIVKEELEIFKQDLLHYPNNPFRHQMRQMIHEELIAENYIAQQHSGEPCNNFSSHVSMDINNSTSQTARP